MPTHSRKRTPPATRRRALELLAASQDGCTEAILLAHGVTVKLLVGLIKARLATVQSGRVVGGGRSIEVARVRITAPAGGSWQDRSSCDHADPQARIGVSLVRRMGYWPLARGAEMSVASAQMMASFVKLLLDQAQQQAQLRKSDKKDEAAN